MPHRSPRRARTVALLPLLAAACHGPPPPPPTVSAAAGYDAGGAGLARDFRDDAPANAAVNPGQFPLRFVDHLGKPVDLGQYRGKSNVVLVVVRGIPQSPGGVFCGHCLAQTAGLMANADEFARRGAVVLVVYPGPADRVAEFIDQARGQSAGLTNAPFPVLLDRNLAACDRLGIRGDLAKPSTYVIDRAGNVVYAYVGETSTDRPSVKAVLGRLDKLGPPPGGARP